VHSCPSSPYCQEYLYRKRAIVTRTTRASLSIQPLAALSRQWSQLGPILNTDEPGFGSWVNYNRIWLFRDYRDELKTL
jgi:hypothetical protein